MTTAPTRPILRYHGGKWKLGKWIISHFPPHRIYVEPFCGAASVLIQKHRTYAEIINDLDGEIVNLFRVLRNPETASHLIHQLTLTPFSRDEYMNSYQPTTDPIEQARRTIFRSAAGFSSELHRTTGFRNNATRSGTTPSHDWMNFPPTVAAIVRRLSGVVIENQPALDLITSFDSPETLFYIDPPYLHSTRTAVGAYAHEMTDADHHELLTALRNVNGMVVLSGYPSDLYDHLLPDWISISKTAYADRASQRTETLWINPAADRKTFRLL